MSCFAINLTKTAVYAKFFSCENFFHICISPLFTCVFNAEYFKFFIAQTYTTKHKSVTAKRVDRVNTHTTHYFFNFVVPSID